MLLPSRHRFLGLLLALTALVQSQACSTPSLCDEPLANNERLRRAIDPLLRPLKIDPANPAPTIQQIAQLLQRQPCVRRAEFDDTIVATEPAQLSGILLLQSGAEIHTKKLTLRYSNTRIWLEKIE